MKLPEKHRHNLRSSPKVTPVRRNKTRKPVTTSAPDPLMKEDVVKLAEDFAFSKKLEIGEAAELPANDWVKISVHDRGL
ncbi:hypothetical protein BH09ACT13_BH09ACT13_00770 [soil metagenome]